MIITGRSTADNIIYICVSVTSDQVQTVKEMYPELIIEEQRGEEDIGWLYNPSTDSFSPS